MEFRSPRHRTIVLPAYWDGGGRMVVRFAPTEGRRMGLPGRPATSPAWNGKTGNFTAAASDAPGFIRAANMHHWAYTERNSTGLDVAAPLDGRRANCASRSWMMPRFRAVADARAAQKFNTFAAASVAGATERPLSPRGDAPNLAYFQRLDERVRYLNRRASSPTWCWRRRRRRAHQAVSRRRRRGAASCATWWAATPP